MAKLNQDFEMYQGEDKLVTFAITDDAGDPADLTGSGATWISYSLFGTKALGVQKTLSGGGIIINGSSYELTLNKAETSALTAGTYSHELRMIDSLDKESVVATGEMLLHKSLTI